MQLCGIEFGNVLESAGVTAFNGDGYRFHHWLKRIPGFSFEGITRVPKTVTDPDRIGNSGIYPDGSIEHEYGDWVRVQWFWGNVLNAMGLPNLSLEVHLAHHIWQLWTKPFFISVASAADTTEKRLEEFRSMALTLLREQLEFLAPWGLQINLSCPNTGHDLSELIKESQQVLEIFVPLNVPLMLKYSIASAPIGAMMKLQDNPHCHAICVSNTLPYDWVPEGCKESIGKQIWGQKESPLKKYGGGGLSGKALKPLVCQYIKDLRTAGFTKPINGGGGILSKKDVNDYKNAGASSIFIGSCAMLRPWRLQGIIRHANSLKW